MRLLWSAAATVLLGGCSWDWDAFDPRLPGAQASSGPGAAGAGPGSGASSSSAAGGSGGGAGANGYRETVLTDGPVSYWRFGEPASATMAIDEVGSAPGIYMGGVMLDFPGAIAGDSDSAAYFDGVDDQVDFGDVHDIAGLSPFSVEAWIAPDADLLGGYRTICAKQLNALDGFELGMSGMDEILVGREVTNISTDPALAPIPVARFSHVVATFDGSSLRIYVDGVEMDLVASQVVLPDSPAPLTAGNSYETSEWFAGVIDELAFYDKALSPTRIAAHFMAGTTSD